MIAFLFEQCPKPLPPIIAAHDVDIIARYSIDIKKGLDALKCILYYNISAT